MDNLKFYGPLAFSLAVLIFFLVLSPKQFLECDWDMSIRRGGKIVAIFLVLYFFYFFGKDIGERSSQENWKKYILGIGYSLLMSYFLGGLFSRLEQPIHELVEYCCTTIVASLPIMLFGVYKGIENRGEKEFKEWEEKENRELQERIWTENKEKELQERMRIWIEKKEKESKTSDGSF